MTITTRVSAVLSLLAALIAHVVASQTKYTCGSSTPTNPLTTQAPTKCTAGDGPPTIVNKAWPDEPIKLPDYTMSYLLTSPDKTKASNECGDRTACGSTPGVIVPADATCFHLHFVESIKDNKGVEYATTHDFTGWLWSDKSKYLLCTGMCTDGIYAEC